MKKVTACLLFIVLFLQPVAWAAPLANWDFSTLPKISVVVFLNKFILSDEDAMKTIKSAINERFRFASIAYYGDDKAKSPEFLEFIEQVLTDPVNEKGVRAITRGNLLKYGSATNSAYIVLINVSAYNHYIYYVSEYDLKQHISVLDVAANKLVENVTWQAEGKRPYAAADYFTKMLKSEFTWKVLAVSDKKEAAATEAPKPGVAVFMPDFVLAKTEAVDLLRKAVAAKFGVTSVPIYIDNKPKSPEFLDLISKVTSDSIKQQTFVLRREHLAQYGKDANINPVIAIKINATRKEPWSSYARMQAEIFVVDANSGKYILNTVYDTGDTLPRERGMEYLMDKLKKEFKIPALPAPAD